MHTRRRQLITLGIAVIGLFLAACSSSVSVDSANPAPSNSTVEAAEATADESTSTETPRSSSTTDDIAADDVMSGEPEAVAAEPTPTVAAVRSRGQQSVSQQLGSGQSEEYTSIRDVDFFNDFGYATYFDYGPGIATVTDGWVENSAWGEPEFYWFGVNDVEYGDLDNDGVEEALIVTTWNGGGTGYFDSVRAFRLVDGDVVEAGIVNFGDRSDGGVHNIDVIDGTGRVWAFAGGQGSCCPDRVAEHLLVLGDYELIEVERGPVRSWISLDTTFEGPEITFEPGTSSGVVALYPDAEAGAARFEARAGQPVTVRVLDGPLPASISVQSLSTGAVLPTIVGSALPVDGDYELSVVFEGERTESTTLELQIGPDPLPSTIAWSPAVEQELLDADPFVRTSVVWPVLVSDQPGTAAANETLAVFATQLDDAWIADVTQFEDPQDDSSYSVTYDVTVVTDEVVSVRFDYFDYVCCRPYPNYGHRSAVFDLTTGEIIGLEDMLDLERINEITTIWIDQLERDQDFPAIITEGRGRVLFDSLVVVPGGLEFGTDRGTLGGGLPGTRTVLTFEQLGDLVHPQLVARAR